MARTPHPPTSSLDDRSAGFTLIEVLVTVAILSITLAMAIPSLKDFRQRQQGVAFTNLLVSHLNLARSSAVTRRTTVGVCPSADMLSCRASTDWTQGWIVFTDPDGNRQPDQPADILWSEPASPSSDILATSSAGRTQARYLYDGRSAGSNLTITVCKQNVLLNQIIINNGGRIRLARPKHPTSCR